MKVFVSKLNMAALDVVLNKATLTAKAGESQTGQGEKEKKEEMAIPRNTQVNKGGKVVFETPQWTIIRNVSSKKRQTI